MNDKRKRSSSNPHPGEGRRQDRWAQGHKDSRSKDDVEDAYADAHNEDIDTEAERDPQRGSLHQGIKLSRDDLQDLAKVSSDLVRRTLLSGFDIMRDVGKELPKEATQFLAARREQVMQNLSKDVIQMLINASIDRVFKTVREHKVEVSVRIVRDPAKPAEPEASHAEKKSPPKKSPI